VKQPSRGGSEVQVTGRSWPDPDRCSPSAKPTFGMNCAANLDDCSGRLAGIHLEFLNGGSTPVSRPSRRQKPCDSSGSKPVNHEL